MQGQISWAEDWAVVRSKLRHTQLCIYFVNGHVHTRAQMHTCRGMLQHKPQAHIHRCWGGNLGLYSRVPFSVQSVNRISFQCDPLHLLHPTHAKDFISPVAFGTEHRAKNNQQTAVSYTGKERKVLLNWKELDGFILSFQYWKVSSMQTECSA